MRSAWFVLRRRPLLENLVQPGHQLIDVAPFDDVGRQKAQYLLGGAVDQQTTLQRLVDDGLTRDRELDAADGCVVPGVLGTDAPFGERRDEAVVIEGEGDAAA